METKGPTFLVFGVVEIHPAFDRNVKPMKFCFIFSEYVRIDLCAQY